MKFDKICILGLGYIGLPTASMFAANGVKVVRVDTNPNVLETLQAGRLHIHEPGLGEVLEKALASSTLSVAPAPEPADAFLAAVPTPFYEHETGEYGGQTYKNAVRLYEAQRAETVPPCLESYQKEAVKMF